MHCTAKFSDIFKKIFFQLTKRVVFANDDEEIAYGQSKFISSCIEYFGLI